MAGDVFPSTSGRCWRDSKHVNASSLPGDLMVVKARLFSVHHRSVVRTSQQDKPPHLSACSMRPLCPFVPSTPKNVEKHMTVYPKEETSRDPRVHRIAHAVTATQEAKHGLRTGNTDRPSLRVTQKPFEKRSSIFARLLNTTASNMGWTFPRSLILGASSPPKCGRNATAMTFVALQFSC